MKTKNIFIISFLFLLTFISMMQVSIFIDTLCSNLQGFKHSVVFQIPATTDNLLILGMMAIAIVIVFLLFFDVYNCNQSAPSKAKTEVISEKYITDILQQYHSLN